MVYLASMVAVDLLGILSRLRKNPIGLEQAEYSDTGYLLTSGLDIVTISKLPDTWVMHNAFTKSKAAWLRMIDEATDESGAESIKGKFLDFKIYADKDHHANGYSRNLLPFRIIVRW